MKVEYKAKYSLKRVLRRVLPQFLHVKSYEDMF